MNMYTSAGSPAGIDPSTPGIVKVLDSFNGSVEIFNGTLPEGIDFIHPTSLENRKV